jgi:hypothetical protein
MDAGGDGQFGTPSPLNPRLAAAQAGMAQGAARISLHTPRDGSGSGGESSAALSPLGHHAAVRQKQWDSAATATAAAAAAAAAPQQQVQAAAPATSAAPNGGRPVGSPVKRAISLRSSAPVFSGYASVALSQQSEHFAPLVLPRPDRQQQQASALRSSRESSGGSGGSGGVPSSQQQQQPVRSTGSSAQLEREASSRPQQQQPAVAPAADVEEIPATLALEAE